MISDYTFGNSQAAVNLMKTLRTDSYSCYTRDVLRPLSKFSHCSSAIMQIPDASLCEAVLLVWRRLFEDYIKAKDIPEKLKTLACCVITTRFRIMRKQLTKRR